jgi:LytS/YehU family sensor histidine kinase
VQRHINNESEESPALLLKLSDLLSYILYENSETWIPLDKELEIIRDYISLEEKNFDVAVSLATKLPDRATDTFIIPSLLLSLIESCFEYFMVTRQAKPLFNLNVTIKENVLHFELTFSSGDTIGAAHFVEGENLSAIRKQLENQYHGLYRLDLNVNKADKYIFIYLKLPLYSFELIKTKRSILPDEISEAV